MLITLPESCRREIPGVSSLRSTTSAEELVSQQQCTVYESLRAQRDQFANKIIRKMVLDLYDNVYLSDVGSELFDIVTTMLVSESSAVNNRF
jgi:hypothetical protein